jgi:nucleotide-binding universal stress UspA family protein
MKILVAVDGSAHSLAMLDALCQRLAWFRDTPALALIYVHPALPYKRAVAWAGRDAVQQYYDEESETALARARDALQKSGVPFSVEKHVGDAATEIARVAKEGAYDLIAMGTHGHTGLTTLVMGSVTTKVVATSTVPVLLLR